MTDDPVPPGLRRLLDAAPDPPVRPVDVPAVLAAAAAADARSARRWRRAAVATAALAAGLLLAAFVPRLEVRLDRGGVAVRWGGESLGERTVAQTRPPVTPSDIDRLEARLAAVERLGERFEEVDRLLAAVSADAADRDHAGRRSADALARRVAELERAVRQVRTDSSAMYAALFPKPVGGVR